MIQESVLALPARGYKPELLLGEVLPSPSVCSLAGDVAVDLAGDSTLERRASKLTLVDVFFVTCRTQVSSSASTGEM